MGWLVCRLVSWVGIRRNAVSFDRTNVHVTRRLRAQDLATTVVGAAVVGDQAHRNVLVVMSVFTRQSDGGHE